MFEDARPDDGRLELGVVNADGVADWVRTLARTAVGQAERSPLVQATSAKKIKVKLNRKVLYEVDGGDREKVKSFTIKVQPAAITICLPTGGVETQWQRRNLTRRAARPRTLGRRADSSTRASSRSSRGPASSRARSIYGIIGLLAFDLVVGHGGKITNQQGALRTVEQHSFGHVLLRLLAIGLGGYALWRLFRAVLGHGREGADRGIERLGALGSGIVYAVMCAVAVQILTGPGTSGGGAKKTASDVFGWPAGRWLVGLAGLVLAGVAIYQFIRGVRQKFLDDSKTEQMPRDLQDLVHGVRHDRPRRARGRLRPCRRLPAQGCLRLQGERGDRPRRRARRSSTTAPYGSWLLGVVALGLIAFALLLARRSALPAHLGRRRRERLQSSCSGRCCATPVRESATFWGRRYHASTSATTSSRSPAAPSTEPTCSLGSSTVGKPHNNVRRKSPRARNAQQPSAAEAP